METMSKTLEECDKKVKKQNATDKYNDRMRDRLSAVNGPGKPHKDHTKEPQKRFGKVRIKETVKIILKPWNKWTNKIPIQLVHAVPRGYYSDNNGTIWRNN